MNRPATRRSVLVTSTSTFPDGTLQSALALADRLTGLGTDMTLASPPGGTVETWWRDHGLDWVPLGSDAREMEALGAAHVPGEDSLLSPKALRREVSRAAAAVRQIARLAADHDLVHSNGILAHGPSVAGARLARRPVILELHDIVVTRAGAVTLDALVRAADLTVAVSEATRDQLEPRAQTRTVTIPQGIDLERFGPAAYDPSVRPTLTSDPEALLAVCAGRLDPVKGFDLAIEAVRSCVRQGVDVHLCIVGRPGDDPGTFARSLRRDAADLGDRVRFLDHTDGVPSLLRAADVVLCPSRREPFGLMAMEALASARAVVAASVGGHNDYFRDGENGTLVPPERPDLVADALVRYARSPELLAAHGAAGAETASSYSHSARSEAFLDVYRAAEARSARAA